MSAFTEDDVEALEWGIECADGTDDDPGATTAQAWRDFTRTALEEAEIEVTQAQRDRAWRVMRRHRQGGPTGSSREVTARAVLAAIEEAGR